MAVRLPTPGADTGNWGNVLNEYLNVSHNPDGTNKDYVNVMDYGAKGDGVTDDTAAIQKAIEAAYLDNPYHQNPNYTKTVFFPSAQYAVSTLDLTQKHYIKLQGGAGLFGTKIYGCKQSTAKPVIDLTGTSGAVLDSMNVLGQNPNGTMPSVLPSVGILIASSWTGGAPANDSTTIHLNNVGIMGYFATTPLYLFGTNDNSFINCLVQSWQNGSPAMIVTGKNIRNIQSVHPAGICQGNPFTSDQTFIQCEFHTYFYEDVNGVWTNIHGRASNSHTVMINNIYGIRFIGGVFSGSGPSLINIGDINRELQFQGNFFESENGFGPKYTFLSESANIYGLSLKSILVHGVDPTGAIIYGKGGTMIHGLSYDGYPRGTQNISQSSKLIQVEPYSTGGPTYVVLSNSMIHASGLDISVGGSIKSTIILDPGKVEVPAGATDTSLKVA